MSTKLPALRHVRGFDVVRPISIATIIAIMLPLVLLPLLTIFVFGTSKGLGSFWAALTAPQAIFALKLSMVTSFWATVFNVVFGLFAAYVRARIGRVWLDHSRLRQYDDANADCAALHLRQVQQRAGRSRQRRPHRARAALFRNL